MLCYTVKSENQENKTTKYLKRKRIKNIDIFVRFVLFAFSEKGQLFSTFVIN